MPRGAPVSLPELIDVMDDVSSWTRFHYLDRETGAVETALTEEVDSEGNFADVRADPGRFVVIDALPPWLRLQVRESFAQQGGHDPSLRLDLIESLQTSRPLLAFQKQLRRHPGLLDEFFAYRLQALGVAATEWLAVHKVRSADRVGPSN